MNNYRHFDVSSDVVSLTDRHFHDLYFYKSHNITQFYLE